MTPRKFFALVQQHNRYETGGEEKDGGNSNKANNGKVEQATMGDILAWSGGG